MTTRPEVLKIERSDDGVRLELRIPGELAYFPDHFPRFPMVPGVVQLAWAVAYGKEHLGFNAGCKRVAGLKFQHPMLPKDHAQLVLTRAGASELAFAYEKSGRPCSMGRIFFS